MNADTRRTLRGIVQADDGIDIVIVHHADGSNDFFSAKPDVERCERMRIVRVLREIADTLESMRPGARLLASTPAKRGTKHGRTRSDKGSTHGCPGGGGSRSACPR